MQRPFAAIFDERAQAAAWKTLPSWAVVATADNAIHPDAERHMALRAGAETIEVDASHSIALSRPTPSPGSSRRPSKRRPPRRSPEPTRRSGVPPPRARVSVRRQDGLHQAAPRARRPERSPPPTTDRRLSD